MTDISLNILNESGPDILQYLPYGITSIEMMVEGDKDKAVGFIYPKNRTAGRNKFYLGYTDNSEDFLVLWGAGKRDGLHVTKRNVNGRLFLQVLHKGKNITRQTLSLCHSSRIIPISEIELVPAIEDEATVRMNLTQDGDSCLVSFTGRKMPSYYSRWFPPRPSRGMTTRYYDIEPPPISIKFKAKKDEVITNVNSDIEIFLFGKKIAEVAHDWKYSWPHAELFTVFGDGEYLVLRLWLYWAHENFSKKFFLGGDALLDELGRPKDEKTRRGIWEAVDIESPDIERFDFLIDMNEKRVSYVGTDFHYQEHWYVLKDVKLAKARIANDVGTIAQVLKNIRKRFDPPENNNPIEHLMKKLKKLDMETLDLVAVPEIGEYSISNLDDRGNVTYRARGITRKHIPYVQNGEIVADLLSSVVTG